MTMIIIVMIMVIIVMISMIILINIIWGSKVPTLIKDKDTIIIAMISLTLLENENTI